METLIDYIRDAGEEVSPSYILDQLSTYTNDPDILEMLTVYDNALRGCYDTGIAEG
jgi:hypothetical protein